MSDGLPGWTCPDIDRALHVLNRFERFAQEKGPCPMPGEVLAAREALESVRKANAQLRAKCAELLAQDLRKSAVKGWIGG